MHQAVMLVNCAHLAWAVFGGMSPTAVRPASSTPGNHQINVRQIPSTFGMVSQTKRNTSASSCFAISLIALCMQGPRTAVGRFTLLACKAQSIHSPHSPHTLWQSSLDPTGSTVPVAQDPYRGQKRHSEKRSPHLTEGRDGC